LAQANYKLKKGQWTDQVINPGFDKTIPLGTVTIVYNPNGSSAGFIKNGTFYNLGEKVQDTPKPAKPASGSSAAKDPLAKYDLPPAVDISGIAKMTTEEIQSHLTEAQKRVTAATKLYQDTPSSDTNYAYIKQANDSAINELNALKSAVSKKPAASSTVPTFDPKTALATKPPANYTGWITYDGGDGNTYGSYLQNGKYASGPDTTVQTDSKTKNWINSATGKVITATAPSQAKPSVSAGVEASQGNVQIPAEFANQQLEAAKNKAGILQNIIDTADTNSSMFKNAAKELKQLEQDFPAIQSKATQAKQSADAIQAQKDAALAKKKLADLQTRADAGDLIAKAAIPAAQNAVTATQGKVTATQTASGVKATGPTGPTATGPTGTKATAPSGPVKPSVSGSKTATGAKTTATATATGGTGPKTTADFMAQYGIQAALIDSDPSLKKLFTDAMAGGWDVNRFKAEFLNTSWAKNNSATWQNAETARVSSPGDYANSYNRMREYIARVAAQAGETLTSDQIGPELKQNPDGSWPVITRTGSLSEWALDQSWGKGIDAAAISQHIAQVGKINVSLPGGDAGNYMSQLKSIANDYGLNGLNTNGGNNYFTDAAQSILLGKSTIDTWKQDIINQAKQNYKAYAPQLDAGITLRSLANPYINSLSNLLELPADSIDLSSSNGYGKMVSDALRGTDPNNPNPMTLNQFETQVKQNPRWGYTNNARDSVMGGVDSLLKMFGKIGA
jgi:hypothetical protein